MAEKDLFVPLLPSSNPPQPSDQEPQLIITVDSNSLNNHPNIQKHQLYDTHLDELQNPFGIFGSNGFEIPESTTVDPFRNHTFKIEGVYEWVKIGICLPIALVRLVLFGLCLLVGYVATKIALHGWKDKENPMPLWRCRLMWVTRLVTRGILFSFGYMPLYFSTNLLLYAITKHVILLL